MTTTEQELRCIIGFLSARDAANVLPLQLSARRLQGGLECATDEVRARFAGAHGHERSVRLVVKRLGGTAKREGAVYQQFASVHGRELAPHVLGVHPAGECTLLFLEHVHRTRAWPWQQPDAPLAVLEALAELHAAGSADPTPPPILQEWDYEAELASSAASTLELVERCRSDPAVAAIARGSCWTRQIVLSLPHLRRQLLAFAPFGRGPIHGDVHPGNVLVRRRARRSQPVLIDWARARIGSPLEDVSSWLQSLGYFEPLARRRHDTLLAGYLSARGFERRLSPELRQAYWIAGASNALAGALRYHTAVALDARRPAARRAEATRAALDWLRILRRADACCR